VGRSLAHDVWRSLLEAAPVPVPNASLRAFRAMFGLLMLGALVRSWQKGVIEQAFVAPSYHFPYYGLGFVRSPGVYTYALYCVLALLSLGIAAGLATRLCAALFCLLFSYLHFVDETYYLNHYYLVSLLSGLLAVLPTRSKEAASVVPRWVLWLFRFQFGVVYFFGGVAKLKSDWLWHAEPLRTWLAASAELPVLGRLFTSGWGPYAFSWAGALYDLSIPFALSYRRTRPVAYAAVVAFHTLTARLFNIGLFPYLMMIGSLLFLSPAWPTRVLPRRFLANEAAAELARASAPTRPLPARTYVPLALYALLQLLVPLRRFVYPGNVLWTEQGYRFSWNVMLMEKSGSAEFRIVDRTSGQPSVVDPRSILTRSQTKAMATQPDMVLSFAHALAAREHARGREVAVYADVFVALNGRAPARLIDPRVDLARERDSFANKPWIVPAPE
jgi:vitamin K-dependent gamma-carboxylase